MLNVFLDHIFIWTPSQRGFILEFIFELLNFTKLQNPAFDHHLKSIYTVESFALQQYL